MATKTTWRLRPDVPISADLARLRLDRRLLMILARAGIQTYDEALAFLDASYYRQTSAYELPDIEGALTRILRALDDQEPILVWGDFDVDGITATSLLIEALRATGAQVDYTIPLRADEGHGVHVPRAMRWVERGIKLVITVDTGISAHTAIDAFNAAGIDVIVTDHHQLPEHLPNALANVNPQRLPNDHPLHLLSGAGVAYKLVEALCGRLNRLDLLPAALELAAIGLIADVVPLLRENRYLVQIGLLQLRRTTRQGIKALCHVAKLAPDLLDEEAVAFQIAPRLNALGRLADASDGVELLTTQDPAQAAILANQVDALNVKRRAMTQQVVKGAEAIIAARPEIADSSVLVVAHDSWPPGVLGLAASQLVEKYQKPALVIRTAKDDLARGSARSIEGINVNALLNSHSHLLAQWGGHDMAAGFALQTGLIDDLRLALSRAVRVNGIPPQSDVLDVDVLLPIGEGEVGAELLKRLAPFGAGFPKPVFLAQNVTILKESSIGREGQHLKLTVQEGENTPQAVLMWNTEASGWADRRVDIAYRLHVRDSGLEIIGEQLFEREDSPPEPIITLSYNIWDWRGLHVGDVNSRIADLEAQGNKVEQWREGQTASDHLQSRLQLETADILVVWHLPPSRQLLQHALERVKPHHVAIVGIPCAFDELTVFIQAVLGAVRFAESKQQGHLQVDRLAGRVGHTNALISLALNWLVADGKITGTDMGASWMVGLIEGVSQPKIAAKLLTTLKAGLGEAKAFRQFLSKADLTKILL